MNTLKVSYKGELLYNANELEPHLALQIAERAIRLSLSHDMIGNGALSKNGINSEFDKHEKPKASTPRMHQPPMWNGPSRKAPLPWDGSGGNGRTRQRLTGRV